MGSMKGSESRKTDGCNHLQHVADIISLDKNERRVKVTLVMETASVGPFRPPPTLFEEVDNRK
jgi:hypothetical protein